MTAVSILFARLSVTWQLLITKGLMMAW